jgi:hypothetical protein
MAAHRYWRVVYPESRGAGALSISEFHLLLNTARVDAAATLTCNVAPTAGALANLKDDDTASDATWSAGLVRGLVLNWDFGGSPQDVTDIRVGSADSAATMLYSMRLQSSDDAIAWTDELQVFAITYPGARSKTASELRGLWNQYDTNPNQAVQVGKQTVVWWGGLTRASTPRSAGVLQFEMQLAGGSGFGGAFGVADIVAPLGASLGSSPTGYSVGYVNTGAKAVVGSQTAYGANWVLGDVVGTVCDFTAGTVTFYKNGVSQGVAASTLAGKTVYPASGSTNNSGAIITLRPANFTFPIAGAAAWDDRTVIKTDLFGRAQGIGTQLVNTAAGLSSYKAQGVTIPRMRRDMNWNYIGQGIGRLKGTTKDKGTPNVPVSERVRLYRQKDGMLMREVFSTPGTGAYSFDYIDELDVYFVVSFDHDLNFRAVIADNLTLANGGVELIA